MAILNKNGKLRGRIGNYIHREVNGKQVIQSSPKPRAPKGGTIVENHKFQVAAQLSAMLYHPIKDFAWDRSYSYLHGRLTSAIKTLLFSDGEQQQLGKYIALDKNNHLQEIFNELPTTSKAGSQLEIDIPKIKATKGNKKLANAEYISYEVALMNFSDDGILSTEQLLKTERLKLDREYAGQRLTVDLDKRISLGTDLLLVLIRTELFKYLNSSAFLNSKELNPAGILGLWKLG